MLILYIERNPKTFACFLKIIQQPVLTPLIIVRNADAIATSHLMSVVLYISKPNYCFTLARISTFPYKTVIEVDINMIHSSMASRNLTHKLHLSAKHWYLPIAKFENTIATTKVNYITLRKVARCYEQLRVSKGLGYVWIISYQMYYTSISTTYVHLVSVKNIQTKLK